jgi:hypothetical protein
MQISDDDLNYCVAKTREIVALYKRDASDPEDPCKSHLDLEWIIRNECAGKEIYLKLLRMSWTACHVRAFVLDKGAHWEIHFGGGMPPDWFLWYKAKELFQIIIVKDRPRFRTTDLAKHIGNMVLREQPESADLGLGHATVAETLAELAAIEFLLPHADRVALRRADGNINYVGIGAEYGLPPALVQWAASDAYMSALARFFGI